MYKRYLNLKELLKHKSLFLLGPRLTGKSTLLKTTFPEAKYIDLLEANTYRDLSSRPELLRQRLLENERLIIIDEIQKLPELLDEVQLLIDRNKDLRFVLTGSSARKLRRGNANLLAGRAWNCNLFPLVSPEIPKKSLKERVNKGGLPSVLDSDYFEEELSAYVGTYLQEEIRAEGLVRSIGNFSRFLEVVAFNNASQLNFSKIASDTGIPARTIREHYQILEDTLLGFQVPCFRKTVKRKPVAKSKFYFFDIGITNTLMRRRSIELGSNEFGNTLEHLILLELKAFLEYKRIRKPLSYWRSTGQNEVDFLIDDEVAIEVKSKSRIANSHLKGLLALKEEITLKKSIVVCFESDYRKIDNGIEIMPIKFFLDKLWKGEIVN